MKPLKELQQAFAADLWRDDIYHLYDCILGDALLASQRLSVYRNNFQISLTEALAGIYPVVKRLVGRDFFRHMADRYIRKYPSRSGNIHDLGNRMALFLGRYQAVSGLPYLPDIARLEWAYHEVFHAAAPHPFEPDELPRMSANERQNVQVDFGSACRLVRSSYPIFRIWKANQKNSDSVDTVNLLDGPESVLIVRPELEVELWRLDAVQATFLSAVRSGRKLSDAVEQALISSPNFNLQSELARYLTSGTLVIRGASPATISDRQASLA